MTLNLEIQDFLPDYLKYWYQMDLGIFIRTFWYFFVFELFRYLIVDIIYVFFRNWGKKEKEEAFKEARKKLFIKKPFVSIIIPGKNEGKHLFKLTKSLAEQTYDNFELIIVDDGSDDETPTIGRNLEKLGLIDLFIRNEQRGGKASGANLALRYSKSKYIVHLDADCSFDKDAIENILVPFFMDDEIGAVGGNVKVRNYKESLSAKLQAIEYLKTISLGRQVVSFLGIYKIVSGAFGAFKKEALDAIGGWDIGPGLDGDITVKIRKSGYKIHFEPSAICLTSVPGTFKKLAKQRARWNKSLIRFRLRKHIDLFLPNANFKWSNLIAVSENLLYNLVFNIIWWFYVFDIFFNFNTIIGYIILTNLTLYVIMEYLQMVIIYIVSERKKEELILWPYVILTPIYTGLFLRFVRTYAHLVEYFLKDSYNDPWNPKKSSFQAKKYGF